MRYLLEKKQYINKGIIIVVVMIIAIFGMHSRFKKRYWSNLWCDEHAQLARMQGSFWETLQNALGFEQFPGDYLLIHPFYKWFGENKWGLAIPHIIITGLGFYLLYILCRKYFRTPIGYIITFTLFAYNYNLINHAFEIRPYSVLVTLGLAAFLVLQYIFEKKKIAPIKIVLISLFIFVTILFHNYGILIMFFLYIFHLLFSREEETIKTALTRHFRYFGVVSFVTLTIWFYLRATKKINLGVDTFEYIHKGVIPILKGIFGNLTGYRRYYFLLSALVINLFVPHRERLKQFMFFGIVIIAQVFFILFLCISYHYWFIQRAFIWVIPLFAFLLGWIWDSLIFYFMGKLKLMKKEMKVMIRQGK